MENDVIEQHSLRNIKSGTLIGYISLFVNVVSGVLFVPLILKQIGNLYGLFSLATSIVNLFLLDFGLSYTANTFLAKKRTNGDTKGIKDILGIFYKLYLLIDLFFLVFFVVYYFLIDFIYSGLTPTEAESFKVVFIICIGYSLISFPATILDGTLSAYEEFGFIKISDLIQRLVYIAFTVLTLVFHLGLYLFVFAHAISTICAILLKYFYIRFKLQIKANLKIHLTKKILKPILSFSIWTAIISILARLPYNLSPNILGIVSDSKNVTIFGISSTIEGYAYLISAVISGFFLPKVSRILKNENNESLKELDKLAKRVAFIQLFIICLIFSGFITCGKHFISLWLGDFKTYEMAYYGTILVLFSLTISIPLTVYNNALFVKGNVKEVAVIDIISVGLFAGLCFVFSKTMGAFGACLSILISKMVGVAGKLIIYKIKLKSDIKHFLSSTYLKFFLPTLITSFFILVLRQDAEVTWIEFFRSVVCCIAIFIILLMPFVDKDMILTLKKVFKKNNSVK